jgi:hypothetical protein
VPGKLGLPSIVPNLVEGIVVKPLHNILVQSTKGEMRPIFKIKNKEFAEEQFHEAQAWSYLHEGASATERLQFLVPELRRYLTDHRLQSTVSKIGRIDRNDLPRMLEIHQAFVADAMASFWEDNQEIAAEFSEADLAWLTERVAAEAEAFLPRR